MPKTKAPLRRLKALAAKEQSLPQLNKMLRSSGILKMLKLPDGSAVFLSEYQFKVHDVETGLKRAFKKFGLDASEELNWRLLIRYLADSFFSERSAGNPIIGLSREYRAQLVGDFHLVIDRDPSIPSMSAVVRRLRERGQFNGRYGDITEKTLRKHLDENISTDVRPQRWRTNRKRKSVSP